MEESTAETDTERAAAAAPPLPPHITYPQKIKSAKDKKTYKHHLLKKNPETLMADYFQKGDKSTITNLLLYTDNCSVWHTAICKYYKNIKKHGICNGRQIQIHEEEEGDTCRAFMTVNIYHNGTIMFQGNEACLNSVQANFDSLKALVESEKQAKREDSSAEIKSSGAELEEEEEELILDCDTQLEESVTQIRNSLSLQEVELVELRELVLSYTTYNETIQKLENQIHQLKKEFKTSVDELKGEIKGLKQERETINRELKGVREELTLRERETQSLKQQTESCTQTEIPTYPVLTQPETNTPTTLTDAPEQSQDQENTSRCAEIVMLMDSNGKFINEKQLFPKHKPIKLWCPNTNSALQQLDKEKLGDPSHIIIHVGTNDLQTQQERVAQAVTHVAVKATQTFPTSKIVISTILPRTDFHLRTIQRINTDISRGCAGMPNVHLVHHSTLSVHNLHDHIHLRKDSVNVLAKNLKDVALGRTPDGTSQRNKECSNPQLKRPLLQTPPHNVFSPNPDEHYSPVPWSLRQQQPMSQNFHRVPQYPHPEQQQPRFPPPHPHPINEHPVPHHRQHHQNFVPPHQQRKKEPAPRRVLRMEQMSAPQPNPHRAERPEPLNYAAAVKGQNDTQSINLREIKDMLNLICTRLMDK